MVVMRWQGTHANWRRGQEMRICDGKGLGLDRPTIGIFWLRSNTGSKVSNMSVDVDKLVEVGLVKMI